MASWKKICCPVDFSNESWFAMEEAAHLAWRFGARLTLLNVRGRTPPARRGGAVLAFPHTVDVGTLATQQRASEWADAAERIASSSVSYSLLTGDPVEEIVRYAEEGRFDVIVMGTRGAAAGGPGSPDPVASAVVLDAPCTVVVARPTVARET